MIAKAGQSIPGREPNHVDQAIGERVSSRRSTLGLASQTLAQKLTISVEDLAELESGHGRFSAEQLRTLSICLDVKPAFFFETVFAAEAPRGDEAEKPNWLAAVLGKANAPRAPGLRTDRIKEMLRRAVLLPGSLSPLEVQELAASVLVHLVGERK